MSFFNSYEVTGPFWADSSRSHATLMEDQAVHVVCDVSEREFRLGPGDADRADEEAEAGLLMREDVLDGGKLCCRGIPASFSGRRFGRGGSNPGIACLLPFQMPTRCRPMRSR